MKLQEALQKQMERFKRIEIDPLIYEEYGRHLMPKDDRDTYLGHLKQAQYHNNCAKAMLGAFEAFGRTKDVSIHSIMGSQINQTTLSEKSDKNEALT